MRNKNHQLILLAVLLAATLFLLAANLAAVGQTRDPARKQAITPWWKVSVSAGDAPTVTVRAEEAPLPRIAGELAKQLGVPVKLSQLAQAHRVTVEFKDESLEAALRSLAPQVYVDYVLAGGGAAPKCIGIYLHVLNEAPPNLSASIKPRSEAILFTGNTEDAGGTDTKDSGAARLLVSVEDNRLRVLARRQPLTAVLYEVAEKLGIAFEMRSESQEVIDLDFSGYGVAELMRLLPSEARLYQRINLSSAETIPLRIILVKPDGN
ncbi:MAG: hypothetical protein HONDAALG_02108 [Gammaproteobacteria bacterium]|nr:hypothetical protein [Gammaproteobacteria bacterium]